MSGDTPEVLKVPFHKPALEEVTKVLKDGLKENFANVEVSVVECPDLTKKPFMLAGAGLNGNPRIADVGGVPHLIPTVQRDKVYNLEVVAEQCGLPDGILIGAGAGPYQTIGVNCEMMANIRCGTQKFNNTHICKVDTETGGYQLKKVEDCRFNLLGNFFVSEGKPGKVLEVKASKRIGQTNIVTCLRKTLKKQYGNKPVGLGGTFIVAKGKAKIHVMPDFSKQPLQSDEEVDNWLKFYNMAAPLICVGELVSHDPDLDLRMEHFHCFSEHGDGGHFHYDVTPDEVEYHGYFNIAEYMIRIDRPKFTHSIGRDISE